MKPLLASALLALCFACRASPPSPSSENELERATESSRVQPAGGSAEVDEDGPSSAVRIRVVDSATGAPAAGATVTFVSAQRFLERKLDWLSAPESADAMRDRLASSVTADAKGLAVLDDPMIAQRCESTASVFHVDARLGRGWGCLDEPPVLGTIAEVRIAPEETLTLRVQDPSGRPCRATRVFLEVLASGMSPDEDDWPAIWHGYTDRDGVLVVRHLAFLRRACPADTRIRARAEALGEDEDAPSTAIELELRDGASYVVPSHPVAALRVEVRDAQGRPVPDGFVHLGRSPGADWASFDLPVTDGVASADGIALRGNWWITAYRGVSCSVQQELRGTELPGDVLNARLILDQSCSLLRGRLFGPDGKPCAHAMVLLEAPETEDFVELFGTEAFTRSDGCFEVRVVPEVVNRAEGRLEVAAVCRMAPGGRWGFEFVPPHETLAWAVTVELSTPLDDGLIELGDLVLRGREVERSEPGLRVTLPD